MDHLFGIAVRISRTVIGCSEVERVKSKRNISKDDPQREARWLSCSDAVVHAGLLCFLASLSPIVSSVRIVLVWITKAPF